MWGRFPTLRGGRTPRGAAKGKFGYRDLWAKVAIDADRQVGTELAGRRWPHRRCPGVHLGP